MSFEICIKLIADRGASLNRLKGRSWRPACPIDPRAVAGYYWPARAMYITGGHKICAHFHATPAHHKSLAGLGAGWLATLWLQNDELPAGSCNFRVVACLRLQSGSNRASIGLNGRVGGGGATRYISAHCCCCCCWRVQLNASQSSERARQTDRRTDRRTRSCAEAIRVMTM